MNSLTLFDFQGNQVRVVIEDGEPKWVAKDVCETLEIVDIRQAVSRLDDDERGVSIVHTPGGQQEMVTINESGLYSLIFTSRKPEAREFKRYVTHVILPTIRKTGQYGDPILQRLQLEAQSKILDIIANAQKNSSAWELSVLANSLAKLARVKPSVPHQNCNHEAKPHHGFVGNKLVRIIPNVRLREWRISQRLTQEGMAVRLETSKAKYMRIETGYQKPNDDFVDLFAETFKLLKDDALTLLSANKGTLERVR